MDGAVKLCAVDVGSNAIRAQIVKVLSSGRELPDYHFVWKQRFPVRLGSSVFSTRAISAEAMESTVAAFKVIASACREWQVGEIRAVGTSAMRDALNSHELCREVLDHTGIRLVVISGQDEARLLALGLRQNVRPGCPTAVIDIGGGSTEIVYISKEGQLEQVQTIPVGAVRLQGLLAGSGSVSDEHLTRVREAVDEMVNRSVSAVITGTVAIGVGGSVDTLVKMKMLGTSPDVHYPDNQVSVAEVNSSIEELRLMSLEQREERLGAMRDRAPIIIPGALILSSILKRLDVNQVIYSERSIRDGLILEMLEEQTS